MAVRTAKDVEKLQEQMLQQFDPYLRPLLEDRETPLKDRDPQALVKEARESLAAAIRERDEGLRMADLRVERRRRELADLESNVRQAQPQTDVSAEKRKPKARKAVRKGR